MQSESEEMCGIPQRLERLRLHMQATLGRSLWSDVATELGLSESMLYQAKNGSRNLSKKAQHRLLLTERTFNIVDHPGQIPDPERAKNYSGTLAESLAIKESQPDSWADAFDSAVLVAGVRIHSLHKSAQSLLRLALDAAKKLDGIDGELAKQIRETAEAATIDLRRVEWVNGDFFEALSQLTTQIPEWLQAALDSSRTKGPADSARSPD